MQRRTFIQLGAVAATLAVIPHQVAQAVETAKRGAMKWIYHVDEAAFFDVALPLHYEGLALRYVAHSSLLHEEGRWQKDLKMRDPLGFHIPKELLTTRYKHLRHRPVPGNLEVL